ncbi:MAG: threonine/serine exporter family protein, partial [Candidatus Krumholzibacteriota bacterium]|nr:threonine/serine exporter family protein [Candidatus Krumholzibacteriota bacterium]
IEKFGRALHRYGLSSHRIEAALHAVARRLGFAGQFFATPTAIFASIERDEGARTILIRVDPGEIHLEKVSLLDRMLMHVISGDIPLEEASRRVDQIVEAPPRYGKAVVVAAFAAASASASRFFGGGWREFVVCAVIGMVTGMLAILARQYPGKFRAFEPLAAFSAGLVAALAGAVLFPMSVYVATCAGLIVLIPGLSLTTGIIELATRNLVAGTSRLTSALMVLLQMGFGVAVGLKTGAWIFPAAAVVEPVGLPAWTLVAALLMASASFTVL